MSKITTFKVPTVASRVSTALVSTRRENGFVITEAEPQAAQTKEIGSGVKIHVSDKGGVKVHVGGQGAAEAKGDTKAKGNGLDKRNGQPASNNGASGSVPGQRQLTPNQQAYQERRQHVKEIMKSSVPGAAGYKAVARIKAIQKFHGADVALRKILVAHIKGEKYDHHLKDAYKIAKKLDHKRGIK